METARQRRSLWSWALYDWANSAFPTVIQTFVFAAYFTREVAPSETWGSTLWGYTIGAAGLVIALGGPLLGAVADRMGRRKPWILLFTPLCVGSTAGLWLVKPTPDDVTLAVLLVGVATIAAEFAVLFYNAMLPSLAAPDRLGRWSGWGWGLGYAGGLACLTIALFVFVRGSIPGIAISHVAARHVRASFLLAAGWYLVFSLPLFLYTPDDPRPDQSFRASFAQGVRQLYDSLAHLGDYRPILLFLLARMLYIDGLATIFAYGGVYAAGTFDMTEQGVLVFGIALNVTAGLGAFAFAWVDDWIGSKTTIVMSLLGLLASGVLILLAPDRRMFFVGGLILGVFVGPVQAASRSFMSRLAPEELRNEMFGLYALSGKATAYVGPLLVGWVTYWSASQRWGMSTVLVLLGTGFVLLLGVPAQRKSAS